jgi:hypothetical protein
VTTRLCGSTGGPVHFQHGALRRTAVHIVALRQPTAVLVQQRKISSITTAYSYRTNCKQFFKLFLM